MPGGRPGARQADRAAVRHRPRGDDLALSSHAEVEKGLGDPMELVRVLLVWIRRD
jgi:hypothetical protein